MMVHNNKTGRAHKTRTEIRQDQITQAALGLIAHQGFRALNINTLAQEIGVVPSAIYRHFASMDAVLDALLNLISRRLQENVEAVRQTVMEPVERLHCLLSRHIQLVCQNKGIPRIVFSEEIIGGQPARRQRLYQIIQGYLAKVAELIQEGQSQGSIRADLPSDTGAVMFLGLVQPTAILHLLSDGRFNAVKFRDEAWRIFHEMIQTTKIGGKVAKNNRARGRIS